MTGPRPVTDRLGPFASGHSGSGSPPRTLALARCAPLVAKLMAWHGRRRARDGASGLRSPTHSYYERGWRATFYTSRKEHSPTSATGTAWERTPWRGVQGAGWERFTKE